MIINLNKYIHDNISLYVCYINLRIVCSKFRNIGKCNLIKFTSTEYRYAGCSVHSKFNYETINKIIQPSETYHFKNKKQCNLGYRMIFGTNNNTAHHICCGGTGISFNSVQNNIVKTGTNSYRQYLNYSAAIYNMNYNNSTNYYSSFATVCNNLA